MALVALSALSLAGCPHDFTRRPRSDGPTDLSTPDQWHSLDRGQDLVKDSARPDLAAVDGPRTEGPPDLAADVGVLDLRADARPDGPTSDMGCPSPCVTTLAGTPGLAQGYIDGPVAVARFHYPTGLELGPSGEIFVADAWNHRIRRVAGGMVATWAGSGSTSLIDGPSLSAGFDYPWSLGATPSGALIVADHGNHALRSISGGNVTTLAGTGAAGFQDGPAANALFYYPRGLAVSSAGEVLVADSENDRVRRISGGSVSTFAGTGTAGLKDGPASQAQFAHPSDLAIDATGQILVADAKNNCIRKIVGGQVTTLAGTGVKGFKDGAALQAQFDWPTGIAVGNAGEIFVADYYNNRIRRIAGGQVTTYAGSGVSGHLDGPAAVAQFQQPADVIADKAGTLYVADQVNHCIRRIK